MSQEAMLVAIAVGLLVIVGLSQVAWRLWRGIEAEKQHQQQLEQEQQQRQQQVQQDTLQSCQVICQALLTEQVPIAEGCIRLSRLLDALQIFGAERKAFVAFDQMADDVSHIPTHAAWKALGKQQRMRFQLDMAKLELQQKSAILTAARQLKDDMAAGQFVASC